LKLQDETFFLEEHFLFIGRIITVIDYYKGVHLRQIIRMGVPEWNYENSIAQNIISLEGGR